MKKKNYLLLFVSLALPLLAGFIGSFFTITGPGSWYVQLVKPAFNPPNWLFGPVWTLLYILMGIALFLVWRQGLAKEGVKRALKAFFIQLAFNVLWSFFFFYLRDPHLAFLEIIALALAIISTMIAFYKVDKRATALLWPYLLWVAFAAFLNFNIWQLNL